MWPQHFIEAPCPAGPASKIFSKCSTRLLAVFNSSINKDNSSFVVGSGVVKSVSQHRPA